MAVKCCVETCDACSRISDFGPRGCDERGVTTAHCKWKRRMVAVDAAPLCTQYEPLLPIGQAA